MNIITKHPLENLGYNFIEPRYLPKEKDEYYLRNQQSNNNKKYRNLTVSELEELIKNGNSCDDWNKFYVSEHFLPSLIRNSKFYGLIRIGKTEEFYLEFHNLRMPVGIYNSTIISCDFGDNVCIDNADYLSHYIIGNEVMIANVNELATTGYAKFGNGIIKDGESEATRVWMELRNENGGRSILPFNGMLPGDAWLWSSNRHDQKLLQKFKDLTEKEFDSKRGYYGTIGDRCVLKDCNIIKDVAIGTDAYVKGANKLKNLTINSDKERTSQIGEGCELVNGIVGFGCRIFYGVKAVRFVMASHSQLKYGARLLNSYLGNNSTISCCEVLNSLIFPAHEQHHNNSFLCAAMLMGQSNIAAGATIGSNHNSRSPDGEIIAGRGFWPGLCVSLKHNSRFASFTILAKGDYPFELDISLPFSLVINDVSKNKLVIMPGYWFRYNMYALSRNSWKHNDRDRRTEKIQKIEYDFLAPDTINEMFAALELLSVMTPGKNGNFSGTGFENSKRQTELIRVPETSELYKELILFYGVTTIFDHIMKNDFSSFHELKKTLIAKIEKSRWLNVGGQLIPEENLTALKQELKSNKVTSWSQVHDFYRKEASNYDANKLTHAYNSILALENITAKQFDQAFFKSVLAKSIKTKEWMAAGIYKSRAKDYASPYRKMVYENTREMNIVMGRLEDNQFIQDKLKELDTYKKQVKTIIRKLGL